MQKLDINLLSFISGGDGDAGGSTKDKESEAIPQPQQKTPTNNDVPTCSPIEIKASVASQTCTTSAGITFITVCVSGQGSMGGSAGVGKIDLSAKGNDCSVSTYSKDGSLKSVVNTNSFGTRISYP
ncbi:hypothetical protein KSF73_08180 [Burkholderiaceae bacterium DAT-1]|nr:hypothetical protein [Burkholderiaceae bacterium DAT-1]